MESKENNNSKYEVPKIILPDFNKLFKPRWETQIKLINDNLKFQMNQISSILEEPLRQVRESMTVITSKILSNLKIDYKNLKDNQKKLAKKMIANGWYFTEELPLNVNELLECNNKSFNANMAYFFEGQLEDIHKLVIKYFPERKNILEKCFKSHKNKDYEMCIPVMLAQADGMSYEIFNQFLFNKKEGIPLTKEQTKIKFDEDSFADIPYYIQLSITGQLNQNCKYPKYFNRHMVIHGKDTNYAKKTNSLRCISILNFLAEIKQNYLEDKN